MEFRYLDKTSSAWRVFLEELRGCARPWGSNGGALRLARHEAQAHDFVENALRHFALAHARESKIASVARKQRHHVGIVIEACAFGGDIVGHDQVGVLGG